MTRHVRDTREAKWLRGPPHFGHFHFGVCSLLLPSDFQGDRKLTIKLLTVKGERRTHFSERVSARAHISDDGGRLDVPQTRKRRAGKDIPPPDVQVGRLQLASLRGRRDI